MVTTKKARTSYKSPTFKSPSSSPSTTPSGRVGFYVNPAMSPEVKTMVTTKKARTSYKSPTFKTPSPSTTPSGRVGFYVNPAMSPEVKVAAQGANLQQSLKAQATAKGASIKGQPIQPTATSKGGRNIYVPISAEQKAEARTSFMRNTAYNQAAGQAYQKRYQATSQAVSQSQARRIEREQAIEQERQGRIQSLQEKQKLAREIISQPLSQTGIGQRQARIESIDTEQNQRTFAAGALGVSPYVPLRQKGTKDIAGLQNTLYKERLQKIREEEIKKPVWNRENYLDAMAAPGRGYLNIVSNPKTAKAMIPGFLSFKEPMYEGKKAIDVMAAGTFTLTPITYGGAAGAMYGYSEGKIAYQKARKYYASSPKLQMFYAGTKTTLRSAGRELKNIFEAPAKGFVEVGSNPRNARAFIPGAIDWRKRPEPVSSNVVDAAIFGGVAAASQVPGLGQGVVAGLSVMGTYAGYQNIKRGEYGAAGVDIALAALPYKAKITRVFDKLSGRYRPEVTVVEGFPKIARKQTYEELLRKRGEDIRTITGKGAGKDLYIGKPKYAGTKGTPGYFAVPYLKTSRGEPFAFAGSFTINPSRNPTYIVKQLSKLGRGKKTLPITSWSLPNQEFIITKSPVTIPSTKQPIKTFYKQVSGISQESGKVRVTIAPKTLRRYSQPELETFNIAPKTGLEGYRTVRLGREGLGIKVTQLVSKKESGIIPLNLKLRLKSAKESYRYLFSEKDFQARQVAAVAKYKYKLLKSGDIEANAIDNSGLRHVSLVKKAGTRLSEETGIPVRKKILTAFAESHDIYKQPIRSFDYTKSLARGIEIGEYDYIPSVKILTPSEKSQIARMVLYDVKPPVNVGNLIKRPRETLKYSLVSLSPEERLIINADRIARFGTKADPNMLFILKNRVKEIKTRPIDNSRKKTGKIMEKVSKEIDAEIAKEHKYRKNIKKFYEYETYKPKSGKKFTYGEYAESRAVPSSYAYKVSERIGDRGYAAKSYAGSYTAPLYKPYISPKAPGYTTPPYTPRTPYTPPPPYRPYTPTTPRTPPYVPHNYPRGSTTKKIFKFKKMLGDKKQKQGKTKEYFKYQSSVVAGAYGIKSKQSERMLEKDLSGLEVRAIKI